MHTAQPGPEATAHSTPATPGPRAPRPSSLHPAHDPRVDWSHDGNRPPTLRHRRDGILPAVAAALSVRGTTLTGTGARGDQPPALHPLVQDFLDTLTSDRRERFTGRCAEAVLLSRHLTEADTTRTARSKRAARRPMTPGEARKALKGAKLTTRHIREDGDPLHGAFAPPCRSCTALAEHFGVRVINPAQD